MLPCLGSRFAVKWLLGSVFATTTCWSGTSFSCMGNSALGTVEAEAAMSNAANMLAKQRSLHLLIQLANFKQCSPGNCLARSTSRVALRLYLLARLYRRQFNSRRATRDKKIQSPCATVFQKCASVCEECFGWGNKFRAAPEKRLGRDGIMPKVVFFLSQHPVTDAIPSPKYGLVLRHRNHGTTACLEWW